MPKYPQKVDQRPVEDFDRVCVDCLGRQDEPRQRVSAVYSEGVVDIPKQGEMDTEAAPTTGQYLVSKAPPRPTSPSGPIKNVTSSKADAQKSNPEKKYRKEIPKLCAGIAAGALVLVLGLVGRASAAGAAMGE